MNINNKKGSVLILSIIISSVFLSLGLSITSIVYKELLRLNIYERSQASSTIADTAWECALYQDYKEFLFSGLTADLTSPTHRREVNCGKHGGKDLKGWDIKVNGSTFDGIDGEDPTPDRPSQKYEYFIGSMNGGSCAKVNVEKYCKSGGGCTLGTIISTIGYDSCIKSRENLEVGRVQRRLYLSR